MKLDVWLRQERPLDERLLVVKCLCQAVNEVHDRGNALGALEPARIELGSGGECDLSAARGGTPAGGYAAPDADTKTATAVADVYSAGAIAWEILAGRAAGRSPAHLFKVRPELPRELADAVMACLEESADWRPKDLTYLAQMAATRQETAGRPRTGGTRAPRSPRTAPSRTSSDRPSRRTWPLLAASVVVIGLGAAAGWRYLGPGASSPSPATATPVAPPATAAETPAAAEPAPTSAEPAAATAEPSASASAAAAPATASGPVVPTPTPLPDAPPPRVAAAEPAEPEPGVAEPPATAPEPAVAAPEPPPVTRPEPVPVANSAAPAIPPDPQPQAEPPAPAPPAEPLLLTAVSPLEVRRPGKVLLDLRGSGFREEHRARVLPVKKAPRGITVLRQKYVNATLITILVELTEQADTGEYAIAIEDGLGGRSEHVIFKINK